MSSVFERKVFGVRAASHVLFPPALTQVFSAAVQPVLESRIEIFASSVAAPSAAIAAATLTSMLNQLALGITRYTDVRAGIETQLLLLPEADQSAVPEGERCMAVPPRVGMTITYGLAQVPAP